jgi:hypothetical protein
MATPLSKLFAAGWKLNERQARWRMGKVVGTPGGAGRVRVKCGEEVLFEGKFELKELIPWRGGLYGTRNQVRFWLKQVGEEGVEEMFVAVGQDGKVDSAKFSEKVWCEEMSCIWREVYLEGEEIKGELPECELRFD